MILCDRLADFLVETVMNREIDASLNTNQTATELNDFVLRLKDLADFIQGSNNQTSKTQVISKDSVTKLIRLKVLYPGTGTLFTNSR